MCTKYLKYLRKFEQNYYLKLLLGLLNLSIYSLVDEAGLQTFLRPPANIPILWLYIV